MKLLCTALFALFLTLSAAPAELPSGAPTFTEPLEFTNTFMPFEAGAVSSYAGKSDGEKTAVVALYLAETRVFDLDGTEVECAVLQETEFEAGALSEISLNYFAQADDGSVYYFGEVVDNYDGGVVTSHGGSWLVGGPTLPSDPVDTATALVPALFMPAAPEEGDAWKPEDLFPIVDETVTAIEIDDNVKVPAGKFEGVLRVEETSAIPDSDPEKKWYAPGVGVVKAKGKGEVLSLLASTFVVPDAP